MNRYIVLLCAAAVVVGITVTMANTEATGNVSEHAFGGKPVIISGYGYLGVSKKARFESVGTNSFVVVQVEPKNGPKYDYWLPLDRLENIQVFENLEDANQWAESTYPFERERDNQADDGDVR